MAAYTLVALDTDHIKQYVFATNKLKEIRGASSLLDHLNRREMKRLANKYNAELIYANGGSGMFVVPGDKSQAEAFAREIQQAYLLQTAGGATISFGVQEIPYQVASLEALNKDAKVHPYMRLLHYRLLLNKGKSHQKIEVLPSHPFMRPCDACGMRYAEDKYRGKSADPDDPERRYCGVCLRKRDEDHNVRVGIDQLVEKKLGIGNEVINPPFAWEKLINMLPQSYLEPNTIRPSDFNKLEGLSGGRDYMALIYADANHMGTVMDELDTLEKREAMANIVDTAIYTAMSQAIVRHLPIVRGENKGEYMFPFDILLIGGDDVMVVTPANVAVDVALTLAREFRKETREKDFRPEKPGCTLSIAVILAPIKYPFGLLHELAETTLKRAKKEAAERENEAQERGKQDNFDMSTINFVVVAGNTGHEFNDIMTSLTREIKDEGTKFYATLRPYSIEELEELREAIRIGKERDLGHTKLHQLREAVMKKNLTTSVSDARAVLNNWKEKQWEHVYGYVYAVASRYQKSHMEQEKPGTWFPSMKFPWFEDGENVYRSPLLDFAELYDFIGQNEQKGGNGGTQN